MVLKLNKRDIISIVMLLPFIEPYSINMLIAANYHISLWGIVGYLFSVGRLGISVFMLLNILKKVTTRNNQVSVSFFIVMFIVLQMVSAYMNGSSVRQLLLGNFTGIGFIWVCNYLMRESLDRFYRIVLIVFGVYSIINAILTILLPDGLIRLSLTSRVYLVGSKNSSFFYYLIFLLVLFLRYTRRNEELPRYGAILILLFLWAARVCDSSNTLICLCIILGYYAFSRYNKLLHSFLRPEVVIIGLVAFGFLVLNGKNIPYLADILEYFGRDLNFTGRTVLWAQAINAFNTHMLFGAGTSLTYRLSNEAIQPHAHSYYLDMLAKSGLLVFLAFLLIVFCLVKKLSKSPYKRSVNLLTVMLLAAFTHSLVDDMPSYFFILIVLLTDTISNPQFQLSKGGT